MKFDKNKELEKIKKQLIKILKEKKIQKAAIFGSYAEGKQKKNSDIDVVIDFNGSLLELVALEMLLRKKLKKKVDLLTYRSISNRLRDIILKQQQKIL